MKNSTKKIAKIFLFICAALCAALVLAQFVPYWTYENSETASSDTISILEYLALPGEHKDVTKTLDAGANEAINSLAGTFCIVLLLGIVSIAFIFVKPNSLWISVWPLVVGVGGLVGYLTEPRWQGGSIHIVLIILSAALILTALVPFVLWFVNIKYWFMDPKDLPNAK